MNETEKAVTQPDGASINGKYTITVSEDGVFLTVYPPQEGGSPVLEPDVIKDLQSRNIKGLNFGLLTRVVKEACGNPVRLGEKPAIVEPEVQVLVDRDRMEASLTLVIPNNSRPLTMQEVIDKIQTAGVVEGLDQEAIQRAFDRPGSRVICAKGTSPINGTDAYMEYLYDQSKKGQPVELADGRVDFKDLKLFTVVNEGDILAEKISSTPGTDGVDVLGQQVCAKAGKDLVIPVGKNVIVQDNKIIAGISGQLQIINNKLNISPVIEIKGDVDLSTGNIDFIGNVIIHGSVTTGFSVKADGNIEVYGTISGGTVEGKNVVVRMGIQGMQRGYVKAKENIATKFIENGIISADNDVIVTDTILHSRVHAGRKVIVEGSRGFIAGGHVMALDEIRAKTVGTHLAVTTDLEVGVIPEIRDEYHKLRKELKQVETSLDNAQKALHLLKSFNQNDLPPDKRELLLRLTKSQFQLAGQVESMRKRVNEIDIIFEEARYGRIRVAETIHPGVKISIGTLVKPIREPLKFVTFHAEEGEIKIGSFR